MGSKISIKEQLQYQEEADFYAQLKSRLLNASQIFIDEIAKKDYLEFSENRTHLIHTGKRCGEMSRFAVEDPTKLKGCVVQGDSGLGGLLMMATGQMFMETKAMQIHKDALIDVLENVERAVIEDFFDKSIDELTSLELEQVYALIELEGLSPSAVAFSAEVSKMITRTKINTFVAADGRSRAAKLIKKFKNNEKIA